MLCGRTNILITDLTHGLHHNADQVNHTGGTCQNPTNSMFNASLHAAARFSKGMPLPPLEESLVRMLRSIAGDDEISQYDTVYTEMKKSARSVKTNEVFPFPDDDKSYADEDMLRDARKLTHTIAAMPNNAIIDDSALGKEECDDAPEVSAAVAAAGTRVTVLTTSEASRRDPLSPGFYTLSSYENLCATGPQVTDLSILKMRYTNVQQLEQTMKQSRLLKPAN